MAAPIALRDDFDGPGFRRLAKATKDAAQARRLLALAEIYDGGSRTDAARIGGVTLQIVRDWVVRFNQHGPDGLINRTAPGNRPKLNEDQRWLWPGWWRAVPSRPSTAWCAGAVRTWRAGSVRSSGSRLTRRQSGGRCAPWVTSSGSRLTRRQSGGRCAPWVSPSSRLARATMPRMNANGRRLKKPARRAGGDPSRAARRHQDRVVVA